MSRRQWTNTTAKDVVTLTGNIWNNDTRTVANAVNYNAQILKDILNRIEELEKHLNSQAEEGEQGMRKDKFTILDKLVNNSVNEVLDKIKYEIEQTEINGHIRDVECFRAGIDVALNVINKYITERSGE